MARKNITIKNKDKLWYVNIIIHHDEIVKKKINFKNHPKIINRDKKNGDQIWN